MIEGKVSQFDIIQYNLEKGTNFVGTTRGEEPFWYGTPVARFKVKLKPFTRKVEHFLRYQPKNKTY